MRSRAFIVLTALGAALVSGGWLLQRGLNTGTSVYDRARLFDDVMNHIARYYVDSVPETELYQKAVDGMLEELNDPHSVYLASDRLRRLTESTSGRYAGLCIQIEPRDGWITVIAPLPDTPAERAGIQTGDRIVEIEGAPTQGWTSDEALRALRGEPGTSVKLVVERPGVEAHLPFRLTRREIRIHSVQHVVMLDEEVGYADITVFSETTSDELRQGIDSLRRLGMQRLVLDLRGNPGGLLEQGVSVSDLFLDPGQRIVSMRGRTREANREFVDRTPQRWKDLPIVVLVDSGSASASEIVAGALQDHDRAVLVGTTSFGKGSAQSLFPMPGGAALKLTTALWYTPSGRSINKPMVAANEEDEDLDVAERAPRPAFRTDAGRTVFGGGGIAPDVEVADRALDSASIAFQRALGRQVPQFRDALNEYVVALKTSRSIGTRDFVVTPAMRNELWRRMERRGIDIQRPVYDAASPLVSRLLAYEIARYVFGRDAEFLRTAGDDPVIAAAIELLEGANSPRQLFTRAARHSGQTAAVRSPS